MPSMRHRRALAATAGGALVLGAAIAWATEGDGSGRPRATAIGRSGAATAATRPAPLARTAPPPAAPAPAAHAARSFASGLLVLGLVDRSRTIRLPDGAEVVRSLRTYVRYPAARPADGADHPGAPPARAAGPFPLIVFGHGFAVTPGIYARLLRSWVQAGYVVAAPVFPLGNADAPGGPDEPDLVNQPADMSFVISSVLAASRAGAGPLAGIVDPSRIAVAGQSDGGDTALAAAYDPRYRDRRIAAAVILSGAEIPYSGSIGFPAHGPPLLATQGTADTINPPALTETFFAAARSPKFLLWLDGAEHLPPYTYRQPWLGVVERASTAFLDHYVARRPVSLRRLAALGRAPGVARLEAHP
jgi:predicted dienelactone hydrolase